MEYVIIWIVCGIIAGMIGAQKGEGCISFIVGVLLGPIGIITAILSKGNRVKCPYCQKLIDKKAIKCPYCHSDLMDN
jgi:hypothetical protein